MTPALVALGLFLVAIPEVNGRPPQPAETCALDPGAYYFTALDDGVVVYEFMTCGLGPTARRCFRRTEVRGAALTRHAPVCIPRSRVPDPWQQF